MKLIKKKALYPVSIHAFAMLLAAAGLFASASHAGPLPALVDNFNDSQHNSLGVQRQFINDSMSGGRTTAKQTVSDGILTASGDIAPARGQPGWASTVLVLDPQGLAQDASAFNGIRLLIKVNDGNISVSANSTEVSNFDYHAALVMVRADGNFHEVKIPFKSMKRTWSEQTDLNTKTISSLSIVAFSGQVDAFEFEVDEVSFY